MFLLAEKQWIITNLNLSNSLTGFVFLLTTGMDPLCKPPQISLCVIGTLLGCWLFDDSKWPLSFVSLLGFTLLEVCLFWGFDRKLGLNCTLWLLPINGLCSLLCFVSQNKPSLVGLLLISGLVEIVVFNGNIGGAGGAGGACRFDDDWSM